MIMSAKLVDGLFVLVAVLANKEVVINKNKNKIRTLRTKVSGVFLFNFDS
jgi:hypothetical protein